MSKQQLYADIVALLKQNIASGEVTGDDQESLEVAIDCIREIFKVPESTQPSTHLLDVYKSGAGAAPAPQRPAAAPVSEADKAEAQKLKSEGNALMAKREFKAAIEAYTKAIEKDASNAIFYANRAAAYAHLAQHDRAAADARKATDIDPKYAKAWTRLGVALWAQGDTEGALDAYENGLKAEGDNPSEAMKRDYENVKKRYEEEKARKAAAQSSSSSSADSSAVDSTSTRDASSTGGSGDASSGASSGGGGGFDFSQIASMMQNPQIQQMAKNLMSDPNALSNLMNSPLAQQMKQKFANGSMPNMNDINQFLGK